MEQKNVKENGICLLLHFEVSHLAGHNAQIYIKGKRINWSQQNWRTGCSISSQIKQWEK